MAIGLKRGDPDLLHWLNTEIFMLQTTGEIQALQKKWMGASTSTCPDSERSGPGFPGGLRSALRPDSLACTPGFNTSALAAAAAAVRRVASATRHAKARHEDHRRRGPLLPAQAGRLR